jgi:hypothetical protein
MRNSHEQFRELASQHGLAVTHQRQVIYEAVVAFHGHHSPESVYAAVTAHSIHLSRYCLQQSAALYRERITARGYTPCRDPAGRWQSGAASSSGVLAMQNSAGHRCGLRGF